MVFGASPGYYAPKGKQMFRAQPTYKQAPAPPPAPTGFGGGGGAAMKGGIGWQPQATGGGFGGGGMGGAAPRFQMPQPPRAAAPAVPQQQTQMNIPEFQVPPELQESLGRLQDLSEGFLDPNSEYYRDLMEGMREQIGKQQAAGQRAAALRGAYSGVGGGQGGEVMQTAADLGQAGLEAMGEAGAGLRLAAPQMGMGALQSTLQPWQNIMQGRAAHDLSRAGLGLEQQRMAQQAASQQQQLAMQQQNQYMNLMASMLGGMF